MEITTHTSGTGVARKWRDWICNLPKTGLRISNLEEPARAATVVWPPNVYVRDNTTAGFYGSDDTP